MHKVNKKATTIYMCQQQIGPSNVTYEKQFTCRYEATMSVYILHIKSLQSTLWPETLVYIHFTLLAYTLEQICLWHCTHIPPHVYCTLYTDPTLLYISKQHNVTFNLPFYCNICASNKYAPQLPHAPITPCPSMREVCYYTCNMDSMASTTW